MSCEQSGLHACLAVLTHSPLFVAEAELECDDVEHLAARLLVQGQRERPYMTAYNEQVQDCVDYVLRKAEKVQSCRLCAGKLTSSLTGHAI